MKLFSTWRQRPRWNLWRVFWVFAMVLVATALWGFLQSPVWLDVSEPVVKVDAIFALGGGADQRPFAAGAIYRKGLAAKLLVPQTLVRTKEREGLTDNESTRYLRVWEKMGIPKEATEFLPGAVDSTRDEARLLKTWLEEHPGMTVGIVTHTWHTRRTAMVFRRALGAQAHRMHVFGVVQDGYRPSGWWKVPGWGQAMLFEWLKLTTQYFSLGSISHSTHSTL